MTIPREYIIAGLALLTVVAAVLLVRAVVARRRAKRQQPATPAQVRPRPVLDDVDRPDSLPAVENARVQASEPEGELLIDLAVPVVPAVAAPELPVAEPAPHAGARLPDTAAPEVSDAWPLAPVAVAPAASPVDAAPLSLSSLGEPIPVTEVPAIAPWIWQPPNDGPGAGAATPVSFDELPAAPVSIEAPPSPHVPEAFEFAGASLYSAVDPLAVETPDAKSAVAPAEPAPAGLEAVVDAGDHAPRPALSALMLEMLADPSDAAREQLLPELQTPQLESADVTAPLEPETASSDVGSTDIEPPLVLGEPAATTEARLQSSPLVGPESGLAPVPAGADSSDTRLPAPDPTAAPYPAAADSTATHVLASANIADAPHSERPRAVVRSAEVIEAMEALAAPVAGTVEPLVLPEPVARDRVAELSLAAPVELWFGTDRIGVKSGTKTYEQFRRYADALFEELRAADNA